MFFGRENNNLNLIHTLNSVILCTIKKIILPRIVKKSKIAIKMLINNILYPKISLIRMGADHGAHSSLVG
jgi:hypothetical protein